LVTSADETQIGDACDLSPTVASAGTFTDSVQTLGTASSYGFVFGDVDGDGDLDAMVTNGNQARRWIASEQNLPPIDLRPIDSPQRGELSEGPSEPPPIDLRPIDSPQRGELSEGESCQKGRVFQRGL